MINAPQMNHRRFFRGGNLYTESFIERRSMAAGERGGGESYDSQNTKAYSCAKARSDCTHGTQCAVMVGGGVD